MGNKDSFEVKRKQRISFEINSFAFDMEVDLTNMNFKQSEYNVQEEKFKPIPKLDKNVRDSEFCSVENKKLSQKARWWVNHYFSKYLPEENLARMDNFWKVIKYNEGGHFLEHCDRQKQLEGFLHLGTEIMIPPKSMVPHEGGQLILIDGQRRQQVRAFEGKEDIWTHVIIPLGVCHQVNKVSSGFRISYVREIWVEDQFQIETDQDRIHREFEDAERDRRYQAQKEYERQQMQEIKQRMARNRANSNRPKGYLD